MRATALSLADRKTVRTPRSSASLASSAVTAAPRPWRRSAGRTPTPVISATPSTAWQLPAATGPSGPKAAASTDCPDRSRSRRIAIVPPSWSAAILSRSAVPASPTSVPGWPKATVGTAQIRSSSESSGATTRTLKPAGTGGAGGGPGGARGGRGPGEHHERMRLHFKARSGGGGRHLGRDLLDPFEGFRNDQLALTGADRTDGGRGDRRPGASPAPWLVGPAWL